VRTLADALRAVPSAAVAQAGAPGAVTSLFLRGGESDHVRVLVDGVPVNHPGGAVDLAALPLEHIERIEVVRGPASVLYGSDAVAGVVQVLTRRGGGAPRVGTEVAVGERGGAEVRGTAAGAWRHVSWSVGAGLQRTDGPYPLNSDWRSRLAAAQLAWTPDAGTEVRLAARLSDGRFHYPTDGAGAVVDSNQEQRGRLALVSLEAGRRLAARLTLRALVGLRASRDSTDDAPDGPGDTTGVYASWSAARVLRRSADVRADIGVGGSGVATLGAAVEHAHERSANGYRSAFGDGGGATDVGRVNRAAYAQAVLAPAGPVALQAGLRLDDNEAFGTFPTWRLGIAVRVAPRTRLRAAAGTAFKEPTFVENYAAGWAVGNPALRPERSRSLEAGVEQELAAGRAQLRLTAFAQRFRDLIQYTFLTAQAGDPNFYNVAAAESRGLEGEVQWMPSAAVRLRAQVTWLHTGDACCGGRRSAGASAATFSREAVWPAACGSSPSGAATTSTSPRGRARACGSRRGGGSTCGRARR
jgi:vitamin B12 transporter